MSFDRIYGDNHEKIRRFLTRVAGSQEAEDLTQIVFVKAASALPGFRGDAQISTWLYQIAAHAAADWLKSRRASAKLSIPLSAFSDDDSDTSTGRLTFADVHGSPEQELFRKQMCECIRGVVSQMPDKHRDVLLLGDLGGLSEEEVATTLGISRGNVKVRLHRARTALKELLSARCDFSHNEDNEFVCEPKSAGPCAPSDVSPCAPPAKLGAASGEAT